MLQWRIEADGDCQHATRRRYKLELAEWVAGVIEEAFVANEGMAQRIERRSQEEPDPPTLQDADD